LHVLVDGIDRNSDSRFSPGAYFERHWKNEQFGRNEVKAGCRRKEQVEAVGLWLVGLPNDKAEPSAIGRWKLAGGKAFKP
jgi:hypothetical protein